jgi:hypothetical protein
MAYVCRNTSMYSCNETHPQHLKTLHASAACYRNSFTFFFFAFCSVCVMCPLLFVWLCVLFCFI